MIYNIYLILFIALFSALGTVPAAANESPARIIQQLQDGLKSIDFEFAAADDGRSDFNQRVAALTPLIESTHDLAYMARLTIKTRWNTLDDDQRKLFINAFSGLSTATYARRFRDLAHVKFRTVTERPMPRGRIEIQTELIQEDAATVALNYVLHESVDGWRIINILAEGVSELALKRTQYQQILKTQDFEALLQYLQKQQAELASEEPN